MKLSVQLMCRCLQCGLISISQLHGIVFCHLMACVMVNVHLTGFPTLRSALCIGGTSVKDQMETIKRFIQLFFSKQSKLAVLASNCVSIKCWVLYPSQ